MFQFNFICDELTARPNDREPVKTNADDKSNVPSERHPISSKHFENVAKYENIELVGSNRNDDIEMYTLNLEEIKNHLTSFKDTKAICDEMLSHNDLKPSVYEGGFKIWECTWDLLEYIQKKNIELDGKRVLDLGCGGGLLGIYAMLCGAHASFQDYNIDVLDFFTIPNILINMQISNKFDEFASNNEASTKIEEKIENKEEEKVNKLISSLQFFNKSNCDSKALLEKLNAETQLYFGDWSNLSQIIKDSHTNEDGDRCSTDAISLNSILENDPSGYSNTKDLRELSNTSSDQAKSSNFNQENHQCLTPKREKQKEICNTTQDSENSLNHQLLEPSLKRKKMDTNLVEEHSQTEKYTNIFKSSKSVENSWKFDVILSSETIYNSNNYGKLVNTIAETIQDDGIVLIGAKSHYFGVGGGSYDFQLFVENDKRFDMDIHLVNAEGLKREVIVLKLKNSK